MKIKWQIYGLNLKKKIDIQKISFFRIYQLIENMDNLLNNLRQRIPIQEISIPKELSDDELLNVLTEISQENPYYVKSFFNKLFRTDIDQDEFYELFSEVINSKPKQVTETDIITYNINGVLVKIRETQELLVGVEQLV